MFFSGFLSRIERFPPLLRSLMASLHQIIEIIIHITDLARSYHLKFQNEFRTLAQSPAGIIAGVLPGSVHAKVHFSFPSILASRP